MRSAGKVFLATFLFVSPVAIDAKDRPEDRHSARLIAETVDLFKAILHDDQETPFTPCLFSSQWDSYLSKTSHLRTYLATSDLKTYLGRNSFHFRLTKQPPPPADILTQAGVPSESVCTPEQREQAENAAIARMLQRYPEKEAGDAVPAARLANLDYGFPIYNARHSKAVLSQRGSEPFWSYKEKDRLIQDDFSGALLVYGKRHGK